MEATLPYTPTRFRIGNIVTQRWVIQLTILVLAVVIRAAYIPVSGHGGDYALNSQWGDEMLREGIRFFEINEANHPPLYPLMNALTQAVSRIPEIEPVLQSMGFTEIVRLKLPAVFAEMIMILAAACWLRNVQTLYWLVPLILAVHPGLIGNSSFWSQSDPINTMFLVFAIFALRSKKPVVAWVLFAVALLTKFQSIVLVPLLVILTFRRFGMTKLVVSGIVSAVVVIVVMLPFIIGSGFDKAMRPYTYGAINSYPVTTVNAYNLWMAIEPGYWTRSMGLMGPNDDSASWFAPFTQHQAGLIFLGSYTLIVCWFMWSRWRENSEFLWAAAIYFGFFMLPTQIHERYLYTGIIMSIFAIAQDLRILIVPLAAMFTFTFNLENAFSAPYRWIGSGWRWWIGHTTPLIAFMNLLLLVEITLVMVFRHIPSLIWYVQRGLYLFLIGALIVPIFMTWTPTIPHEAVIPISSIRVSDNAEIVGYRLPVRSNYYTFSLYWVATRPIYDLYKVQVELVDNGEVVAMTDGSYQDEIEGSWRWIRGQVHWTTYSMQMARIPRPDAIYITVFNKETGEIIPTFQRGGPVPGGRVMLVDLNAAFPTPPTAWTHPLRPSRWEE